MSVIPGSLVVPGAPAASGGGVQASNYLSLENTDLVTPTLSGATISVWDELNSQGSTGAQLKSDNTSLQITKTGIFVIYLSAWGFSWTAQAGGTDNMVQANLAFTVADTNSLAHDQGPDGWMSGAMYDETKNIGGGPRLLVTTPPMRLQANDTVSATMSLISNATASTAPHFPIDGITLTAVQLA